MENTLESDFILSLQCHVIYKQFDYTTIIMGHPVYVDKIRLFTARNLSIVLRESDFESGY